MEHTRLNFTNYGKIRAAAHCVALVTLLTNLTQASDSSPGPTSVFSGAHGMAGVSAYKFSSPVKAPTNLQMKRTNSFVSLDSVDSISLPGSPAPTVSLEDDVDADVTPVPEAAPTSEILRAEDVSVTREATLPASAPEVRRILSLDGGGIRGLMEVYFLREIERQTGRIIGDMFDFVAGTSVGAIIAVSLTQKDPVTQRPVRTATELFDIMMKDHDQLFKKRLTSFGGLFGARYKSSAVKKFLASHLADDNFEDSTAPTLVVSQDLTTKQPKFFASYDEAETYKTVDVAMASSAAPTYYKPHAAKPVKKAHVSDGTHHFVDGGLVANNPSLIALIEARKMYPTADRFEVYSLGTGFYATSQEKLSMSPAARSIASWGRALPGLFMGGQMGLTEGFLSDPDILGANFMRWNPEILGGGSIRLDDDSPETITRMLSSVQSMIDNDKGRFNKMIAKLSVTTAPSAPIAA